jgi:mannitol 2-dehydrogenase
MNRGTPGLSILSCDNIQQNGDICKNMLLEFMMEAEPELVKWVESNCSFPNSMVDRITPATKSEDIELLKARYGIEDNWPVVCEPFIQWVIEDKFSKGRPKWESVGVQFVKDVAPYERMKIRLLNAGHSLLGLSGTLYGYKTIDETVKNPIFETFLRKFMDEEVTPVLGKIDGVDIEEYKSSLIQRFSNENIKDQLSRICAESSAKIPKFLLPTVHEQLVRGGSIQCGALVTASWCRYLELSGTNGYNYIVEDVMYKELFQKANASMHDDPLSFLKIKSVFGNLADSNEFVDVYIPLINNLRKNDIKEIINQFIIKI